MIPRAFHSGRVLAALNCVAIGCSLATATAAIISIAFSSDVNAAFALGVPTCALGIVWAALLRWRRTVGKRKLRLGWVASIPLALVNGALGGALVAGIEWGGWRNYVFGAVVGATVGAVFWIPGLAATLAVFGYPLAHAQRLAAKGLAGEERGERVVGLACLTVSIFGLVGALFVAPPRPPQKPRGPQPPTDFRLAEVQRPVLLRNAPLISAFGLLGALTGATAAGLALQREARRRRFVADVEAGKVAGFRVDDTSEGRVLVRVLLQGTGYRVGDVEEEVVDLDASGAATGPSRLARRASR